MVLLAIVGIVLGGIGCLWYGVNVRYDSGLRAYRHHDPFRREQEHEGALWIMGGGSLFLIAVALWWITRT